MKGRKGAWQCDDGTVRPTRRGLQVQGRREFSFAARVRLLNLDETLSAALILPRDSEQSLVITSALARHPMY